MRPECAEDWLLVAGDVRGRFADIEWAPRVLSGQFVTVAWAPGNREMWTHPDDEVQIRGEERYMRAYAPGAVCCDEWLLYPA